MSEDPDTSFLWRRSGGWPVSAHKYICVIANNITAKHLRSYANIFLLLDLAQVYKAAAACWSTVTLPACLLACNSKKYIVVSH